MEAEGAQYMYSNECKRDVVCPAIAYQSCPAGYYDANGPTPEGQCPKPPVCKPKPTSCPIYNMPRCTTGSAVSGGVGSDGCTLPPRCPGDVTKCGVNTFSVKGTRCDGGFDGSASGASASLAIIAPSPDREASYTAAYFQCYDGYSETMGESSSCKPVSVWQKYAQEKCASRCNTTIPVSGSTQGGSPYESFMWVVNSLRDMGR